MVEEDDFLGGLVRQYFTDFLKPLGPLEQGDQKYFHVVVGPYIAFLELHLILQGVLDQFE